MISLKVSPKGSTFSHLFFADDLVLFANADEKSCNTILETLNDFCNVSGQKVNFQKSKLFCSANVPQHIALKLSFMCAMSLTNDLGTYLGAPLIHGRFNHAHCNSIIEKIQKRLAG